MPTVQLTVTLLMGKGNLISQFFFEGGRTDLELIKMVDRANTTPVGQGGASQWRNVRAFRSSFV